MVDRVEYVLPLNINGRSLRRVLIDQHYLLKHAKSIDDQLILELVKKLNHRSFRIQSESGGFQYFAVQPVSHETKHYRLVLVLCIAGDYLGVINAFRIKKRPKL
jgi:hypothetical protein